MPHDVNGVSQRGLGKTRKGKAGYALAVQSRYSVCTPYRVLLHLSVSHFVSFRGVCPRGLKHSVRWARRGAITAIESGSKCEGFSSWSTSAPSDGIGPTSPASPAPRHVPCLAGIGHLDRPFLRSLFHIFLVQFHAFPLHLHDCVPHLLYLPFAILAH